MNTSYNCIAVIGPTASGKTTLAARIAYELRGEVVSADSRQVYRGLDIGSGKDLDQYVVNGSPVPFHLISIADPSEQYYLHNYIGDLQTCFKEIIGRHRLPVICGGSGLYLDALRKNFANTQIPENSILRSSLEGLSRSELMNKLRSYPDIHTAGVDKTSVKRMIRGIEIAHYLRENELRPEPPLLYRPYYLGIKPGKEKIASRIRQRLEFRIKSGLIDEVSTLLSSGISHERLEFLGLEYKFISLYLKGELPFGEMKEKLFIAIRQFSKRQMTWFRKMEKEGVEIRWIEDNADLDALMNDLKELFIFPQPK